MTTSQRLLRWTPRVFGLLFAASLTLFALDAFEPGRPLAYIVVGFLIHLLSAYLVGAATVVGWHNPVLGGLAFLALAMAYVATAAARLPLVTIGLLVGPAGAIAALFLLSAFETPRSRRAGAATPQSAGPLPSDPGVAALPTGRSAPPNP